jgi:hypothetical protein
VDGLKGGTRAAGSERVLFWSPFNTNWFAAFTELLKNG